MDRAAELNLPFDIDHVALAELHAGGDSRGLPEREAAQLEDRQPVDLPDLRALGVDQDRTAFYRVLGAFADPVGAADLRVDRLLDVALG